jgi:hypothetical protein
MKMKINEHQKKTMKKKNKKQIEGTLYLSFDTKVLYSTN